MTAWIFGAELYWLSLTAGCVKPQLPAPSNRVRHNGKRIPAAVLVPVSIWFIVFMLKPATYASQKHSQICLWWLLIPQKNYFDSDNVTLPALTGHTVLHPRDLLSCALGDVPATDNKSRGCCCRNSLPTVIHPLNNTTKAIPWICTFSVSYITNHHMT